MEASAGAHAAAPAAPPPASPAAPLSAAAVRSAAKGAASPKPLLARYAPPSTDRCPACGAPPLSEKDLQIVRKPGRRSTRDADDPRNRMENLVTREFLEKHIVQARMSLRDIGCFHGYTISTLSRRAKQEAVLVGARARNAAEAASSQQDGAQQQSAPAAKPAQRRKPSSSSKSRRKSQAAGGEEEVEDGSEAEGGTQHWQAIKRQRRAPAPARKPPLAGGVVGGLPQLPLVPSLPLPPAAVALPMGAFVQPAALLDAQQLQAQMQIMRAQFEQNEIFAHVVAQTRPVQQPLLPVAPAAQQAGAGGGKQGEGGAGQAGEQEEREADTDEEDVAELLGLLRHRSPACPSSLAAPPSATQAAATAAVAAASAAEQRREEAQQAAAKEEAAAEAGVQLQEGEAVKQGERQQPADKQEQQPGVAGEPQAAAPGEQPAEAAAAAVKAEAQPAAKQEAQPAVSGPQAEQQPQAQQPLAKQQQLKEEEEHAASDGGADDMALDPTLAPSTAPIDDPHLETLCLSQPVSLAGCGTEPCSPTAASQPPDPAEWQARQQPAGSQAGEGQGSHQVGAAHAAGQQQEAQQHAAWGDQGSQPDTAPGSLSPQMAAVKSSAAQLSLGRAIEAFQAADIDSSMSMLLPLRRLQRAGKGGAALQEVVAHWNEYPLPRQQNLFAAAVLHALEGRWDALEADLAVELDAGR